MNSTNKIKDNFEILYLEIESLKIKINKKDGWLIFKTHRFSIEELSDSPNHQRIMSVSAKIGDDIKNWANNNKLSQIEEDTYYEERRKFNIELHKTNLLIEDRDATFWEKAGKPLKLFVIFVMNNLPEDLKEKLYAFAKRKLPQ